MQTRGLQEDDQNRLASARWVPSAGPFSAFGRSWTFETDDPDLSILVEDLFADLASDDVRTEGHATFRVVTKGTPRSLVARNGRRLGGGSSPSTTMDLLVWGVNRWVLDEASRDHLLLHAGGVVREDGLAVLLPAPSESGKSTLTTGLLKRGFAYLSDEAIAILPDGVVRGYAKPVSIDRGAWDVLAEHRPDPTGLGVKYLDRQWHVRASKISTVASVGRVGALIFPRYSPLDQPSINRLSPAEMLVVVGASTFAPEGAAQVTLHQIQGLASSLTGVPAYRLVTNDLDWSCEAVSAILADLE